MGGDLPEPPEPLGHLDLLLGEGILQELQVDHQGGDGLAGFIVQFPGDAPALLLLSGDDLREQLLPFPVMQFQLAVGPGQIPRSLRNPLLQGSVGILQAFGHAVKCLCEASNFVIGGHLQPDTQVSGTNRLGPLL